VKNVYWERDDQGSPDRRNKGKKKQTMPELTIVKNNLF
jgi:hypothetical protein